MLSCRTGAHNPCQLEKELNLVPTSGRLDGLHAWAAGADQYLLLIIAMPARFASKLAIRAYFFPLVLHKSPSMGIRVHLGLNYHKSS